MVHIITVVMADLAIIETEIRIAGIKHCSFMIGTVVSKSTVIRRESINGDQGKYPAVGIGVCFTVFKDAIIQGCGWIIIFPTGPKHRMLQASWEI